MASRIIQIQVTGEAGQYEATVNRIIDKNNQLNRAAIQGAQATTNAFGNLQRILINIPSFFSGIASGIAGAFGIGSIIAFTKSILNAAGQIDDLSKKTGFSRQTLSGLKSTIEENGGSLEGFANAINKAQRALADVEGDGKKAAQALKAMGLNVNDLAKQSPEKFFETFAEALSKVEGQNNRVAIATRVMGRAGADQIPVILALTDQFKKLSEQGVSDANIKLLDKFGDAIVRLTNSFIGLAQNGLAAVIRGFDRLFAVTDLEKARQDIKRYSDEIEGIDKRLQTRESLRGGKFTSFFTVPQSQDASEIQKRAEAQKNLFDATDRLLQLQKKEQEQPATNVGGGLPIVDEGAAKRQLEALEQAKTKLLQLKLANAEAARAAGDLTVEVRTLALALIEQEKVAAIAAARGNKSYTAELGRMIEAEAQAKIAAFEASEALKVRARYIDQANKDLEVEAELAKTTAEAWGFYARYLEEVNKQELEKINLTKELADLEADKLTIVGRTTAAEKLRIENQIKYLQALKEQEGADSKKAAVRDAQIANEHEKLRQLGIVTVNVGQTIASSVGDAFEGVILGTRKLADVGKGLMSALLRDIGSFFTQALVKKLGFENILLSNASGFLPQLAGLFDTSSGSGVLSNIASLFGSFFGGGGPVQLSGPGAPGGPTAASAGSGGGGGFGISTIGSIFSTLGSAYSAIQGGALGTTIATALADAVAGISTAVSATSTAILTTLDTIAGYLSNPVTWIAAVVIAVVTAIWRIVANQQERPNAKFSGIFQGVSFDPLSEQFVPGDINVAIGRKSGIKNQQAGQIADNLQKRLVILANQWTDILNIFPDFIAEDIQPALDETNRRLNENFRNIKFSPGGSRSIAQELEAMSGPDGLVRFFQAFQPSLAHAFSSTLQRAGIGGGAFAAGTAFEGFKSITPGWKVKQEDWDKFIAAIKDVSGVTSQLGTVGASKFLTSGDIAGVSSLFEQLFSITDMATFTKAAAEIQEKLKPATDFLSQSVQEASELFGRGLIAALEAATESDAQLKFLQTIGEGVKDKIFSGLVEAFTASAQYQDLLAPIQKTIREFAQEALATGQAPDVAAFRAALFPNIEAISSRAQTLAPLIAELQKLGFDIKDSLGLIAEKIEEAPAVAGPTKVEINIENYTREDDPAVLARRIGDLLSGRLAPSA